MMDSDEKVGVRELRDAVATLEIPPVRNDSLARVMARRTKGERIALRTNNASTAAPMHYGRLIAVLLAAVAALIVVAITTQRGASVSEEQGFDGLALSAVDSACANAPTTTSDSSALRHLMIATFGIPAACGAEPGQDPPIAYVPSQIGTGTFTYGGESITDGVFTSIHGSSSVTISRMTYKGVPAILAVREGALSTGVHLDSLIVSADGPAPLYFASIYHTQHPPGAIRAEFDSAMITVSMTRLDTIAKLPFHMKRGQLPYGFAIPLAVPALPLAIDWHGTIEIAPPIHPRAYKLFLRPPETIALRVIGREKVRVPAGVFDCWKLRVGEPESESFLWVSTSNHLPIRSASVSRFGDTSFDDRVELQQADFVSP